MLQMQHSAKSMKGEGYINHLAQGLQDSHCTLLQPRQCCLLG